MYRLPSYKLEFGRVRSKSTYTPDDEMKKPEGDRKTYWTYQVEVFGGILKIKCDDAHQLNEVKEGYEGPMEFDVGVKDGLVYLRHKTGKPQSAAFGKAA